MYEWGIAVCGFVVGVAATNMIWLFWTAQEIPPKERHAV